MTEAATQTEKPKNKKQLQAERAQVIEDDYSGDSDDIVNDSGYRMMVKSVLEALGYDNGLAYLDAGVDKRVACGLEPLDLLDLAKSGKLKKAVEASAEEVFAKTEQNAEDSRIEMEKAKRKGRTAPMGGPVKLPAKKSKS